MEKTLSESEERYIAYWEKNRLREKRLTTQLLIGLPLGIVFASPILLNLFTGWHKLAAVTKHLQVNPVVVIIACLFIVTFVAIFSRRHKWEMKEQQYREFLAKRDAFLAENSKKGMENTDSSAANHSE
jgi:hypothetical protein